MLSRLSTFASTILRARKPSTRSFRVATQHFPVRTRCFSSAPDPRSPAYSRLERGVANAIAEVPHPKLGQDVIALGMIKNVTIGPATPSRQQEEQGESEGAEKFVVAVELELDKQYREIKRNIISSVSQLPWVHQVRVNMHVEHRTNPLNEQKDPKGERPNGLSEVKNIIAVASCKGGVGKSTVAVNLAYALSQRDFQVGIFDADIYGPSLPTMVSPPDTTLREDRQKMIVPPVYQGVKTMSYGYVKTGVGGGDTQTGAAVMRGPMVSNLVTQLCNFTLWGDLDYLILDFPPGTGDIQISMSQQFNIDAAVIVTTPQKLSFVDVIKGIEMFDKVKVPTVAVVENMSEFICAHCGQPNRPFGFGYQKNIQDQFGIENAYSLPVLEDISLHSDSGDPFILDNKDTTKPARDVIMRVSDELVSEVARLKKDAIPLPTLEYNKEMNVIKLTKYNSLGESEVLSIDPVILRGNCRCAHCVDEYSGEQKLLMNDVREDVHPVVMQQKGNYAYAFVWSDGHNSSIYPNDMLMRFAS